MSKKVEKRKCAVCGKAFTPKSPNATVCGEKCRKVNRANHKKARAAKPNLVEKIKLGKQKPAAKPSKPAIPKGKEVGEAEIKKFIEDTVAFAGKHPLIALLLSNVLRKAAVVKLSEAAHAAMNEAFHSI